MCSLFLPFFFFSLMSFFFFSVSQTSTSFVFFVLWGKVPDSSCFTRTQNTKKVLTSLPACTSALLH